MVKKNDLPEQTKLAFDLLQKLYLEVSYFIKELEGLLSEEEEKFVIGRPAGYGISTRGATQLEANNVYFWLLRKLAVFFVPADMTTKASRGQTATPITKSLKVLYFRFVLNDKDGNQPTIYSGVLYNIQQKAGWKRFERAMGHFAWNDDKLFKNFQKIDYEDSYIKIQGKFIKNNLYDVNDSKTILNQIIRPTLELYRRH